MAAPRRQAAVPLDKAAKRAQTDVKVLPPMNSAAA
jgi:hypothetical protein